MIEISHVSTSRRVESEKDEDEDNEFEVINVTAQKRMTYVKPLQTSKVKQISFGDMRLGRQSSDLAALPSARNRDQKVNFLGGDDDLSYKDDEGNMLNDLSEEADENDDED